mmetsp:Transcript_15141/g.25275  ORF Transcript_15141/g.25275 Transcript_15141/m.25275 type:complete len:214 (+) Transcript_15141:192-833(+)
MQSILLLLTTKTMVLWPKLVIFDLDFTLWHRPRFRGGPPFKPIENGLGGITARDGAKLDLYPAARRALCELAESDVPVAVVSRTHRKQWALQWLSMLRLDHASGPSVRALIGDMPIVIRDGSKRLHVWEIARRTGIDLCTMLYFDDALTDVRAVEAHGVTSVHCPAINRRDGRCGLTDALFAEGLQRHARLHAVREQRGEVNEIRRTRGDIND